MDPLLAAALAAVLLSAGGIAMALKGRDSDHETIGELEAEKKAAAAGDKAQEAQNEAFNKARGSLAARGRKRLRAWRKKSN